MSMPPTAMRLMRWQSSHRVMADSILAAVVLILNVLLGLGPVLTANTPIASWLPITITAIALCTAALCVRRTYPVVAWAAVVLIPTAHDIAIYHIYHFDPQTFTIIVNSLPAYNVIAIPMCWQRSPCAAAPPGSGRRPSPPRRPPRSPASGWRAIRHGDGTRLPRLLPHLHHRRPDRHAPEDPGGSAAGDADALRAPGAGPGAGGASLRGQRAQPYRPARCTTSSPIPWPS